jgi:aspartyl-tRNA(Asn)/glutamyl-tRNA(Gln) amidotransferase subunit A
MVPGTITRRWAPGTMTRREALALLLSTPFVGTQPAFGQASELTSLTIAEASRRLAARSITPLQLANAYLTRIGTMNALLNAYVTVTTDLARREARELGDPKGPLWGIPIAHKDLFETRGVRTTAGSMLFEDYTPGQNAAIVQQLENAGAVMLGKTNTHELGGGVTTINPFFGTTRNPADATRIPGGSSGGSAAAVAAHLCAAATGSDTGGSVRIPAAFCGCVGFKPTFGRISTQGLIGASPSFDHVGFLSRTVEDAQILFDALIPARVTSAARVNAPANGGTSATSSTPAGIRAGIARSYFFEDLDPVVANTIGTAIEGLKSRGAVSADVIFPIDSTTMSRVFDPVFSFEMWGRFGADWRTNPGSFSKSMAGFFSTPRPSIAEYESGLAALKEYQAAVDKLFASVDVIITPTTPVTAPPIAGPIDGMKILRNTWPFNAAGTPAISVPLKTAGLPVGMQFIARRGEDDKLLRIVRSFFEGA